MNDRGHRWPWLIAAGSVALLLAAIAVAARSGRDAVSAVAEGTGVLITVAGGCAAWALRRARPMAPPSGQELDGAARALAVLVRDQWSEEAAVRGLLDPGALAVRWRGGQDDWGDYEHVVGGTVSGSSDDMGSFAEEFRALPHRRLVVLGEPGAGKTTLAVLLLRELLEHPEPGDPVPVLLGLSSWNPRQEALTGWIARRLRDDYPALGNRGVYGRPAVGRLLADRRVLPVLDGLDELPGRLRPHALIAINRALAAGGSLVLTCRSAEYHEAVDASDVVTAAAVCVAEPVTADDAVAYLADGVPPRRARAWEPVFARLRDEPGGALATAFATPLNVWLARTVYGAPDSDPAELIRIADESHAIQDRLLDALVPAVFTGFTGPRAGPGLDPDDRRAQAAARWRPEDARRWLGFLADHLNRLGTDDLAWWRLDRAVPSGAAGPLTAPLVAVVFGCGGASLAAPYFRSAFRDTADFGATAIVTAATVAAVLAVMRSVAAAVTGPRRLSAGGPAAAAALVVALAVAVGDVIGRYGTEEQHAPVGWYYDVRATPGMAWRAGIGWAAAVCVFGALAAFASSAAVRRHGRSTRQRISPLMSQAATVVIFGAVFWLGAASVGADVTLPIVQRHGLWRQARSVSEGAAASAVLFLLVAGVVSGLRMGGPRMIPAYLDFRLRGRLSDSLRRLPAALARGAALGTALGMMLGIGWGLTFPDYPGTPALPIRVLILMALGSVIGLLAGVGLALVRWAWTPADTDQATPVTTLRGDRRLTLAVLLISVLPLAGTWLVLALTTDIAARQPDSAAQLLADIGADPEAGVATGLAGGLLSASSMTYFRYLEARVRLAADDRLPRDLVRFLEDARLLRVLRQVGAVYQFCHATLQQHLAAGYARDVGTLAAPAPVPRSRPKPSRTSRSRSQP